MTAAAGPPAGWYPDPQRPGWQRYWDGSLWTDHHAPPPPAPVRNNDGLITAGWICALFVPIAGLVIGAILSDRDESQGGWIMLVSGLFMIAAIVLVTVSAF